MVFMNFNTNKYGNKKIEVDGKTFDSQKEANRYYELRLLERAGVISDLQTQVKFELIPAQYETFERIGKNGKPLKAGRKLLESGVSYYADFVYKENGKLIVEDTKGGKATKTDKYIIKRKLMLYIHGIKITELDL